MENDAEHFLDGLITDYLDDGLDTVTKNLFEEVMEVSPHVKSLVQKAELGRAALKKLMFGNKPELPVYSRPFNKYPKRP